MMDLWIKKGRSKGNKQKILGQMKIYNASYQNLVGTNKTPLGRKALAPNALHTTCKRRHIPDSAKGPLKSGGKP